VQRLSGASIRVEPETCALIVPCSRLDRVRQNRAPSSDSDHSTSSDSSRPADSGRPAIEGTGGGSGGREAGVHLFSGLIGDATERGGGGHVCTSKPWRQSVTARVAAAHSSHDCGSAAASSCASSAAASRLRADMSAARHGTSRHARTAPSTSPARQLRVTTRALLPLKWPTRASLVIRFSSSWIYTPGALLPIARPAPPRTPALPAWPGDYRGAPRRRRSREGAGAGGCALRARLEARTAVC
jgi:hypothetical protein